MPLWANMTDKDLDKLEKVQIQCLRRVTGALTHSSSTALEVVCGILPMRFRRRELCCREYIRILAKDSECKLRKMMNSSTRVGQWNTSRPSVESFTELLWHMTPTE